MTTILLATIESNLFSPLVVGRRLALSPISVFLSVMAPIPADAHVLVSGATAPAVPDDVGQTTEPT